MRYALAHRTTYSYSTAVELAHHKAHLAPRAFPGQRVLSSRLTVYPPPRSMREHRDHFGNLVSTFEIDVAHTALSIEAVSEIDVALPEPPPAGSTPPWETVRDALAGGGFPEAVQAAEFVHDSPLVAAGRAARAYARPSFPPGRPVLEGALDLTSRIKADFAYRPGATDISTPLAEVFEKRAGVCQDFAHVEIAALRSLGLAAGYVSGYIRTYHAPGMAELRGADASHAWVAAWCGPGAGWVHLDPTNNLVAREEHAIVAWGRDFSDVSPVRGVILGGGSHTYGVAVELKPTG